LKVHFIKRNRIFIKTVTLITGIAFNQNLIDSEISVKNENYKREKMKKTESEWKKKLSSEEYHVLREKGTERAFTGVYDKHFEEGLYLCSGCGIKIFESESKYDSGCGWPAFSEAIPQAVEETQDNSFGMKRIEITCKNCDGHLGHVFNDGPKPSGVRYCINSVSMDFLPKNDNKK
jgi:peptide-methionine (R)-S-oxide reductase